MMDAELEAYSGLVHATAARLVDYLDDDLDDIKQALWLKVWQAREKYNPTRSKQAEEAYVFSCVYNRVKDLLKAQSRLNARRGGGRIFVEDSREAAPERFDFAYLATSAEEVYRSVDEEPVALPSTLTLFERQVVLLLLQDFNRAEIGRRLRVPAHRVRSAHEAVQRKMEDWRPGSASAPVLQAA